MKALRIILSIMTVLAVAWSVMSKAESSVPGDTKLPRCEVKTENPLSIDSEASNFGLKPCDSTIVLYSGTVPAGLTVTGQLQVSGTEPAIDQSFTVTLQTTNKAVLTARLPVQAAANTCRGLTVTLKDVSCTKDNTKTPCPPLRLKTSMVYKDLSINGDGLNICYAD